MGYWTYVKHRLRYDSYPQLALDILAKTGIYIQPFYIFLEGLSENSNRLWECLPAGYRVEFLGPEDMHLLASLPERNIPEQELKQRLKEGKLCLGIKYKEDLAAFTWCNMAQCTFPGCAFDLKENEAYLFDAHTSVSYRGKGLAPFARYQLYLELSRLGKTRLYSFSDMFNKPAIRFKQKLNSRIVDKGIYVRLFHKWHFPLTGKHWRHQEF
jgi:hypothetical protein